MEDIVLFKPESNTKRKVAHWKQVSIIRYADMLIIYSTRVVVYVILIKYLQFHLSNLHYVTKILVQNLLVSEKSHDAKNIIARCLSSSPNHSITMTVSAYA